MPFSCICILEPQPCLIRPCSPLPRHWGHHVPELACLISLRPMLPLVPFSCVCILEPQPHLIQPCSPLPQRWGHRISEPTHLVSLRPRMKPALLISSLTRTAHCLGLSNPVPPFFSLHIRTISYHDPVCATGTVAKCHRPDWE